MGRTPRVIKKYANRRLYDTETSQSVTLNDVRDLIGAGEPVRVVEAKTDKDVTRSVLLQIVADQELLGHPVLSNEFLEAMIKVNSNPMKDLARDYLEQVMTHLESQQEQVEDAWRSTMGGASLDGVAGNTMEPLRKFQQQMFSMWSEALNAGSSRKDEDDNDSGR